jgi:drug/metabolite transporter (DMT)-like permease
MSKKYVWYLLLALSAAAAGAIYPFTKLLAVSFSPLSLSFFRYFVALFPMLPFFIIDVQRKRNNLTGKTIAGMAALGVLGVAGFALLFFYGVVLSTGTNGSVLVNTQPIFAVLLTPLLMRERFSIKNLLAAAIGIFGIVLVITGGSIDSLRFSSGFFTGNILLIGASFVLTVYSILLKPYIVRYGGTVPTFITFTAGTIVLAAVVMLTQGYIAVSEQITGKSVVFLLFIGFFSTAMMYIVFNRALETVGIVESIGFKLLIPVFGILLSVLVLYERPAAASFIGAGVVISAIIIIQLRKK